MVHAAYKSKIHTHTHTHTHARTHARTHGHARTHTHMTHMNVTHFAPSKSHRNIPEIKHAHYVGK